MTKQALSVSIVIPVYNEQHHLQACLKAIASQTEHPKEVIVVDNNSTDGTVAIAKSFPFVRVVPERKQGRVFARNRGFDAATGDIIGRIDADSVIRSDWVARIKMRFERGNVSGLSGLGSTVTLPRIRRPHTTLWCRVYYWGARLMFGVQVMWGANMAISRQAWAQVRGQVCLDERIAHEDTDLTLLMLAAGMPIKFDSGLRITTNGQSYHYWPKLYEYCARGVSTLRHHKKRGSYTHIVTYPSGPLRAMAITVTALFCAPFFIVSFLLWPIDWLVTRFVPPRTWLN